MRREQQSDADTDTGLVLGLLRLVRGWYQADVATAARLPPSAMSEYERGKKAPRLRTLKRLVMAMGFDLSAVQETQVFLLALRQKHGIPSASDRAVTPELWQRLKAYPPKIRLALVRETRDFQHWTLCEFICFESVAAAADDAAKAVELAELAVALAEHLGGDNPWTRKVRSFAWAHLANARRVAGDHRAAEEAWSRSDGLWQSSRHDPTLLLSRAWVLAMKASLRVPQRRLPEAIILLEQALEEDHDQAFRGTILVSQARARDELGDFSGALALLRQAEAHVD